MYRLIFLWLVWMAWIHRCVAEYNTIVDCGDGSNLSLSWNVDYKSSMTSFTLEILNRFLCSNCVVGFGLSGSTDKSNVDVVFIRKVDKNVEITDTWVNEIGYVSLDTSQDYVMRSLSILNDVTVVTFERHIHTCDIDDYDLDNGTTYLHCIKFCSLEKEVIDEEHSGLEEVKNAAERYTTAEDIQHLSFTHTYSYGRKPQFISRLIENMSYGTTLVQLLKPAAPSYSVNTDMHFDIRSNDVTIPAKETTYWCSVHKLPNKFSKKIHGIGFAGVIDKDNTDIVHHMEVFRCNPADKSVQLFNGNCDDQPPEVARCDKVLGAWAKGADPFFYPVEAGIPFDPRIDSKYLRLEVHYYNPEKIRGRRDGSGIRFYYTDTLRQYDAGILELGITYNDMMAVPPHQNRFIWSGFCPSVCTNKGLDDKGIYIFGSQLHTHLIGQEVVTSQSRDGVFVGTINEDKHYSTWFQEIRHIDPPTHVLGGDSLVTSCIYDSSRTDDVTPGGFGIEEEMCVNYVHYFPASRLEVCKSSISTKSLLSFFLVQKMQAGKSYKLDYKDLGSNYEDIEWDEKSSQMLQKLYDSAPVDVKCLIHGESEESWIMDDVSVTSIPFRDVNNERNDSCS